MRQGLSIDISVDIRKAMKILQAYPINAHKVIDRAIRRAGTVSLRLIRSSIPQKKWRYMARGVLKSYAQGVSFYKYGVFAKDRYDFNWMKAYWMNYGTLSRRDPNHTFRYPRKTKTAQYPEGTARWRGGQRPVNFFEKVAPRSEVEFKKKFIQEINKQTSEILETKTSHARTTTTSVH